MDETDYEHLEEGIKEILALYMIYDHKEMTKDLIKLFDNFVKS